MFTTRNIVDKKAGLALVILQLVFVLTFGLAANYGSSADPIYTGADPLSGLQYSMFEDVQLLTFVGIGLLLAYLKSFMLSSLGFIFLVGTLSVQYGLICSTMWEPLRIDNKRMFDAETLAIVILISMGAIHGKVSTFQQIILVLLEAPIYTINCKIEQILQVTDTGGGIGVHLFGAYFGLAAALMIGRPSQDETNKVGSSYNSDVVSLIGTMLIWVYWPSFNAYDYVTLDGQQRSVINTYLALSASCVTAFALSSLFHAKNKFTMAHVQNVSLAGGVAIASSVDLAIGPWAACLVGTLAAVVSITGMIYVQPFLTRKVLLHDTGGIHNLHGIPAILGSLIVFIFTWTASTATYGPKLYNFFPAMSPIAFSTEFIQLQTLYPDLEPGEGRTAGIQAGYQLLWMTLTLMVSLAGGIITGLAMKICSEPEQILFEDANNWVLENKENENRLDDGRSP